MAQRALLEPKFTMPQRRSCLIERPRLTAVLDQASGGDVILISAPAGFGKTTLLSDWAAANQPVAWLSLDEADNDPARFWRYVVAALRTVDASIGTELVALLDGEAPDDWEALVTLLIADISRATAGVVLALDDYHLIRDNTIHAAVGYLLHRQPPQLRVVLLSRADPPLALARLRVQERLQDIRAADLRFNTAEMKAFVACALTADLSPEAFDSLAAFTEGWPAGLQLAALSLRGQTPAESTRYALALSGAQRYILDYLLQEVLQQQDAPIQTFLLHTSLLHNLTPPLCTAVTGDQDAARILDRLAAEELFIQPLDDEGRWYRYNRLFAAALRAHLQRTDPAVIPDLRRRASAWYAERSAAEGLPARLQPAWATQTNPFHADLDDLLEPLTEREAQVLALIGQGLSNQQIADHLVITVGTVKGHITHLLDKLQAQSRTEAVARARYLGLLDP